MELTKEYILNKYPLLYEDKNASMRDTCMCWGLDGEKFDRAIHQYNIEEWKKSYINEHVQIAVKQ